VLHRSHLWIPQRWTAWGLHVWSVLTRMSVGHVSAGQVTVYSVSTTCSMLAGTSITHLCSMRVHQ
jgi:hypothetical protein